MGRTTVGYDGIKAIIADGDASARAALAAAASTPPEVLYYMAEDDDAAVRRAVAGNPATPPQADAKLARDADVSVRCALARKAVGEGLDESARRNLWRMGFTILETLARDRVVRVRKVLAEAFCSPPDAPHEIVVGLARDREEEVAAPVLRGSPVLTDDDVMGILDDDPPGWAQEAVAGRATLSAPVAEVLAGKGSVPAVARMLENAGATIPEAIMEGLAERSAGIEEWQAPMVSRPGLTETVLLGLARAVAMPLLAVLRGRRDMSPDFARRMESAMAARPDGGVAAGAPAEASPRRPSASGNDGESTAAARARSLHKARRLNGGVLAAALDNRETDFLIAALALRAGLPAARVRRMVNARSGRTMMALAWRAGLSARFGLDLQRELARIPPSALLYARDGLEFPLTVAEMKGQLALFE